MSKYNEQNLQGARHFFSRMFVVFRQIFGRNQGVFNKKNFFLRGVFVVFRRSQYFDIYGNIYFQNIFWKYYNGNGLIEDNHEIIQIFIGQNLKEKIYKGREKVKGKEYDYEGRLLFKGEFLYKNRWNGKFKEYYKDKLVFKGDYLEGEIWSGRGRKYNKEGKIDFEGEYVNGKMNGIKIQQYYGSNFKIEEGYING